MKSNVWLDVIIVIAWTVFFGLAAAHLSPGDTLVEVVSVVSGASFGLLVSWSIRYLRMRLKDHK